MMPSRKLPCLATLAFCSFFSLPYVSLSPPSVGPNVNSTAYDPSLCEQWRSGTTNVALFGTGLGYMWLYDSANWTGYKKKVDLDDTVDYQHQPPFNVLLYFNTWQTTAGENLVGWPLADHALSDITNAFILQNGKVIVVTYGDKEDYIFSSTLLKKPPRKLNIRHKLENILVLGGWMDRFTWGITTNESGRACLVGIEFTWKEFDVQEVSNLNRCIEGVTSPVRLGHFCTLTGMIMLFFKNGSISIWDTIQRGVQHRETKTVGEFFQCTKANTAWYKLLLLLAILVCVVIIAAGCFIAQTFSKKKGSLLRKLIKSAFSKKSAAGKEKSAASKMRNAVVKGIKSRTGSSISGTTKSHNLKPAKNSTPK